jgi:hypothetical protein
MVRIISVAFFANYLLSFKWKRIEAVLADVGCCSWDLSNCKYCAKVESCLVKLIKVRANDVYVQVQLQEIGVTIR